MKNDFFPKIHHVTMVGLSKRCLSLSVPKIRFWAAAPKGTKSCRTQGESVRLSLHMFVCTSTPTSIPPAPASGLCLLWGPILTQILPNSPNPSILAQI